MKKAEVESFLSLASRIEALHIELSALSKKNPNDGLNKFKLNVVNSVIQEANLLLGEGIPLKDFEQFAEDDIPTTSDAVFILALYRKALEKLRSSNIVSDYGEKNWHWQVEDSNSSMKTNPPTVL